MCSILDDREVVEGDVVDQGIYCAYCAFVAFEAWM